MTTEKAKKDPGPSFEAAPKPPVDAPLSDVHLKTSLSSKELRAFLGRPATQARIREVVMARVDKKTPAALVDNLVQQANVDALMARSPPRSMETAMGWLGTLTVRAVVNHFRRDAVHANWLRRDVEVEELPPEPDESEEPFAPKWLVTGWLRPLVAQNPRDQETYELLVYKASTGKTHAQVAANHGMTEGALKTRVRALKTKYEPQWRRRREMFVLLILFGLAVTLAAIVWLLSPSEDPVGPYRPITAPIIDQVLGRPEPVSHPRPQDGIAPDGG